MKFETRKCWELVACTMIKFIKFALLSLQSGLSSLETLTKSDAGGNFCY
jgi:hypothetical protein